MPIDSESGFIWKFLWKIMLTPFIFIGAIFGKKNFGEVFEPIKYLFEVLFQARVTISLIIINIITFIGSLFLSESTLNMLASHPTDIFSTHIYTLITSGFLHAGIGHLLGNMLALMIFGRVVERELGSGKTFLIYFGALIISGLFSSVIYLLTGQTEIVAVGASGAIMGLVSAAALLKPWYITFEIIIPLPIMVVSWMTVWLDVSGVLNPTADGIGHFAHLGGYLSVAIMMFLLEQDMRDQMRKGLITNVISIIVVVILAKIFGMF